MVRLRALDVAACFIEHASVIDENDLTNLKLQKLLYFAQGHYLAAHNKKLFDEPIEAWSLGPVVKSVYDTFKQHSCYPITVFDVQYEVHAIPDEIKHFIEKVWSKYGKFSASFLVDLTHKPSAPWHMVYTESANNVISDEALASAFKPL